MRRFMVLALLPGVLVLAGCSSGSGGRDTGADAASAETTSTTTTTLAPEVTAEQSAGCGSDEAPVPGLTDETLDSGGQVRTYRQLVPSGAEAGVPLAVVLNFHGLSSNADQQQALTGMEELADAEGFMVLTPQGLGNVAFWNYVNSDAAAGDVGFVSDLIDATADAFCIDLARVYATGMSNGGLMSTALACRLPDQIAAVSAVAGLAYFDDCDTSRPVAVQVIYGTDDEILPYEGGLGDTLRNFLGGNQLDEDVAAEEQESEIGRIDFPPVDESMDDWAAFDGCDATPVEDDVSAEVLRREWPDCDGETSVVLYQVDGGGHTWPGSPILTGDGADTGVSQRLGYTTDDISASELAWEFFQAHPKPTH